MLNPAVWGRGFATEAAHACAHWCFRNLDVPYLTAMIRPDNIRSIRVAERLGMTPLRHDVLLDIPVVVYSISPGTGEASARRPTCPARRMSPTRCA